MKNQNPNPLTIEISHGIDDPSVPSDEQLTAWAKNAASDFVQSGEIDIRICSVHEIQSLNAQYRDKDKPTNVLSFPSEPFPGAAFEHLGDIAVCADVVAKEAQQQSKPIDNHWAHLITHGVLHLLGYDHIEDDEAEEMEALERDILARIGIPDPYQ